MTKLLPLVLLATACHLDTGGLPATRPMSMSEKRDSVVAYWGQLEGLPPLLAVAVSHVEVTDGRPDAVSKVGAVGVMQVMPALWQHAWPECGSDLTNLDTNACKGVKILAWFLQRFEGDTNAALAGYSGGAANYAAKVAVIRERLKCLY